MNLAELQPRWVINEPQRKLFIFLCPHCRKRWLSCKNFVMSTSDQIKVFADSFKVPEDDVCASGPVVVVPMKAEVCWTIEKHESWDTISVRPSIDASPSGDWHGHITDGAIK